MGSMGSPMCRVTVTRLDETAGEARHVELDVAMTVEDVLLRLRMELPRPDRSPKSSPIGRRITALREEAGLTQAELARLAGISRPHLNTLERVSKRPTAATLEKIARGLGVDVAVLATVEVES